VQVLQLSPKIAIGKRKYRCRYYNEAPKLQLVKGSTGVGITMKPQKSSW